MDLTKEQLVEMYRRVLRIRRFDEKPTHGLQGLVWRQMLTLSLTFDHQGVDGTPAAAFLQAVCKQLEAPAALAGVRGIPEKPLFPFFAAAGGQSTRTESAGKLRILPAEIE